jgi:hypothetical protein
MARDLDRDVEAKFIPVNKQHTKHTLSSSLPPPPVLPKEKKKATQNLRAKRKPKQKQRQTVHT